MDQLGCPGKPGRPTPLAYVHRLQARMQNPAPRVDFTWSNADYTAMECNGVRITLGQLGVIANKLNLRRQDPARVMPAPRGGSRVSAGPGLPGIPDLTSIGDDIEQNMVGYSFLCDARKIQKTANTNQSEELLHSDGLM
ncbi:hypothetical protein S40293_10532 [Stachybotrys chartarum IBT 40293]|nr:hypothetical protein S40293_10532 [Stachybotrys chartarum IBT 40293]